MSGRESEVEATTWADEEYGETVDCEAGCGRVVPVEQTVDVVAGAVAGSWSQPGPYVGVTGVDGGAPTVQKWCTSCAETDFGVHKSANARRIERVRRIVTPGSILAFLFGVALALAVASVMIV